MREGATRLKDGALNFLKNPLKVCEGREQRASWLVGVVWGPDPTTVWFGDQACYDNPVAPRATSLLRVAGLALLLACTEG